MPIYEFECSKCQKHHEVVLPFSEAAKFPIGTKCKLPKETVSCECGSTTFSRSVAVTGRMGAQWSSWNSKK